MIDINVDQSFIGEIICEFTFVIRLLVSDAPSIQFFLPLSVQFPISFARHRCIAVL